MVGKRVAVLTIAHNEGIALLDRSPQGPANDDAECWPYAVALERAGIAGVRVWPLREGEAFYIREGALRYLVVRRFTSSRRIARMLQDDCERAAEAREIAT